MPDYGFSKEQKKLIAEEIEKFLDISFEDWTKEYSVTDKKIHEWEKGDIIDVQDDHYKTYIDRVYSKTRATKLVSGTSYSFFGGRYNSGYIIYKPIYFPQPEEPLVITDGNGWKMKITTYDGALRVYKQITGKKLAGFEDLGKEIYH